MPIGDLVALDFGSITQQLGSIAEIIVILLIVAVVMYLAIFYLKYKHPVYLYMQEGDGVKIVRDKGQLDKKKRKFKLLKNRDVDCIYPESKFFYRQGKSSALTAYVKNQSASWLTITPNPHFMPADINMQNHLLQDIQGTWEIIKPKETFWSMYGKEMLWGASMGIFLVVIILILKRMDKVIDLGHATISMAQSQGKQVIEVLLPVSLMRKKKK